jgi:hypothetical protein
MSEKKPVGREFVAPRDLSAILKDAPLGAWVALSHDKTQIVATGDSMRATTLLAQSRGEDDPVLVKMPLADEGLAAGVR